MGNEPSADIMSTREAANYLDVSVRTVQLWVENGCLQAWKTPGGHRRILRHSVEEMMEARQTRDSTSEFFEILICEDDDINCRLIELQLSSLGQGVRIRTVSNGFEALIRIGERCPHLLITDIVMPSMDGIQMLDALQKITLGHTMHIIVVTSLNEDELKQRGGLPVGITHFSKPVPFTQLLRLISIYMEIRHVYGKPERVKEPLLAN